MVFLLPSRHNISLHNSSQSGLTSASVAVSSATNKYNKIYEPYYMPQMAISSATFGIASAIPT